MSIHEIIKNNSSSIAAIFSTIAVIGSAALYVEHNFASASDLKAIATTQQQSLRVQSTQQRQMSVFQLEYYDEKVKKLQEEKHIAFESVSRNTRSLTRPIADIQSEIDDVKRRREIVLKTLTE